MIQPSANSAVRKQRDQQDFKRMVYRRAIEEHAQMRRLKQELGDVPEQLAGLYLSLGLAAFR